SRTWDPPQWRRSQWLPGASGPQAFSFNRWTPAARLADTVLAGPNAGAQFGESTANSHAAKPGNRRQGHDTTTTAPERELRPTYNCTPPPVMWCFVRTRVAAPATGRSSATSSITPIRGTITTT